MKALITLATQKFKEFAVFAAPVLKDAFIHAAKVFAYIVLSAAIAAVYAFVAKENFDPTIAVAINVFLAASRKAIEVLNK